MDVAHVWWVPCTVYTVCMGKGQEQAGVVSPVNSILIIIIVALNCSYPNDTMTCGVFYALAFISSEGDINIGQLAMSSRGIAAFCI